MTLFGYKALAINVFWGQYSKGGSQPPQRTHLPIPNLDAVCIDEKAQTVYRLRLLLVEHEASGEGCGGGMQTNPTGTPHQVIRHPSKHSAPRTCRPSPPSHFNGGCRVPQVPPGGKE